MIKYIKSDITEVYRELAPKKILVFKTNINTPHRAKAAKNIIDKLLPNIKWNFDLEDCDNILRIESEHDISVNITEKLKDFDIQCSELRD